MKKRILSLMMALALLLTCVPMATAAQSGFVTESTAPAQDTAVTGPVQLPVDDIDPEETSGLAQAAEAVSEPKIVHDASGRFSESAAAEPYAADDVVRLVVVMKGASLLAAGYTVDEIAAQTASVTGYQNRQLANLDTLKAGLT